MIQGDLKEKVVRIKAKGSVSWAVAVGAIALGVMLIATSPASGGAHALLSAPALAPAITVLGAGATLTAVKIAAVGGIAILSYMRDKMDVIDEGSNYIVLRKDEAKKYISTNIDAEAMYTMGKNYYEGSNGMPKNKDMAIHCLK